MDRQEEILKTMKEDKAELLTWMKWTLAVTTWSFSGVLFIYWMVLTS